MIILIPVVMGKEICVPGDVSIRKLASPRKIALRTYFGHPLNCHIQLNTSFVVQHFTSFCRRSTNRNHKSSSICRCGCVVQDNVVNKVITYVNFYSTHILQLKSILIDTVFVSLIMTSLPS